jgi:hypothetical protein
MTDELSNKAKKFLDKINEKNPGITEWELIVLLNKIAFEKGIFKNLKERSEKIANILGDKASFTVKGYEILLELYEEQFRINDKIKKHFKSKHYIEKD